MICVASVKSTKCCGTLRTLVLVVLISLLLVFIPVSPAIAATGSIILGSNDGPVGTLADIAGSGFTANKTYSIKFATTTVGTGTTDSSGDFADEFAVPIYPRGQYDITVTTTSDTSNTEYFTVMPEITLNSTSGRSGSQVTVSGSGFKASSSVTVVFDSSNVGSALTNTNGSFSNVTITVPSSTEGKHTVTGKDIIGASPGVTFTTQEPDISFDPDSGHVGDTILVDGSGFKPSSSVTILFDGTTVGNAMTNTTGIFSNASITIPPGSRGEHTITGRDTIGMSQGVVFNTLPSVSVAPLFSAVGDKVTITGYGFAKNSAITFIFDNMPVTPNTKTDTSGTFTGSFAIPEATEGEHTVRAGDASGNTEDASVTVTQKLSISPATGPAFTIVAVTGTGFGANKAVAIKYNGAIMTTNPVAVKTDSRGSFNTGFEIPASSPGSYTVEASDGSYTTTTKFDAVLGATLSLLTSEAAPGHVGMQLTINGAGFKPNANILVTRASTQEKFATINTDLQGTFSVTFTVPPSPGGKHTIIVTDGVSTKEFDFFIEREPPLSPLLLQPDIDKKVKRPISFDWNDVSDISGVSYTLQISTDEQFTPVLLEEENLTESEYTIPQDKELKSVTRENPYYWRVKSVDGASNESEWSEIRTFSVGFILTLPNGEPELTVPAWAIYAAFSVIILLAALSFWVGRKLRNRY